MRAQVPLFKQWDERWAGVLITPPEAADCAVANGFYPADGGTSWECRLYPWEFLAQDNAGTGGYVAFIPQGDCP